MDPAGAFAIAAGVLQTVHLSFEAVAKCRELYRDGSLAEDKSTKEFTQYLADTVNQLYASVDQTPTARLPDATSKDILDIATKCSETAKVLLAELGKLQLDSRRELGLAIGKTLRAIRKKRFLEKVQKDLEEYRRILDTRILVRLDGRSLQQGHDFQSLNQTVRDLVVAMNQGHNTFEQILADRQAVLDHIDRGFAKQTRLDRSLEAQHRFKNSLFFPEILARQEQIPEAHLGTCRWIFHAPIIKPSSLSGSRSDEISSVEARNEKFDRDDNPAENGSDGIENDNEKDEELFQDHEMGTDGEGTRPWSDFVHWLECGEDVYWINGKPGSGKSTLMNYITSEDMTKKALAKWANGSDIVTAAFFFWNPGTALQKSLQGLLRSLLYQIAEQRQEFIHTMMEQQASLAERPCESLDSVRIHSWTEKRLLSVLVHFLNHKPTSVRICFFIDGLDECIDEENNLMKTIHLLKNATQVKVCVSSRREHAFLQEFQDSPQLRLQDFNRRDMERMTSDKLRPVLHGLFPQEKEKTDAMIDDMCDKAQGVFLWLDLVIKDIIKGARNRDTMQELTERLQATPDTIEDLYTHMLNKLDKLYLADAQKYFRLLMANQS